MTACGLNGIATGSPKGTLILSICHQPAKVLVRGGVDTKKKSCRNEEERKLNRAKCFVFTNCQDYEEM